MLSFFYTSLVIVRSIVHEKESRMKVTILMKNVLASACSLHCFPNT